MNHWAKFLVRLHNGVTGQGLVEYALIIALMCFAAAVAMQTIAVDLNNAFTGISKVLSAYVP
jgi:Flp pilus assembly pilin Flp